MLPSRPALGVRGCQVLTSVFAPLPVEALAHTTYVSLVLWSKREVG